MLFELGILGFVLLAVGYWATLFTMGRREDVLHGKFVEVEPGNATVKATPEPVPAPWADTPPQRASAESLQSLLAVIKQDLQDAART
jgi:hypothetical protein